MQPFDRKARLRTIAGAVLAVGGLAVAVPAQAQAAAPDDAAARCAALADGAGFLVRKAELVAAGPAKSPPGAAAVMLPRHCLLQGVINPRTGHEGRAFGIGFELRMPIDWNGRFVFQGGGGLDGAINPAIGMVSNSGGAPALSRGFAVVSTDAGHSGPIVDASFGLDQQARIDFGYNALDKVTLAARRLVERYYGRAPSYSYFLGCSNGGRQALMASQRLPLYFDGIVAGDPAIGFSRLAMDQVWNQSILAKLAPKNADGVPILAKTLSDADLKLVRDSLLKRCDARDGLKDGMINDWQRCDFDPAQLACAGEKTQTCLSKNQVSALQLLHRGPRLRDGGIVYGPFNYDTGIASPAWRSIRLGTAQDTRSNAGDGSLGLGQLRQLQLTPPDPAYDPADMDVDDVYARTRATAALADADNPFLESFVRHGKMIVYNGLADQGMSSNVLADWYQKMLAASGADARNAVRLFLVPGMLHCGGGEATDQFEMLDAIQAWVEHGQAPDRIVATGRTMPDVTRPLCPFPQVARYKGGNAASAASFSCED